MNPVVTSPLLADQINRNMELEVIARSFELSISVCLHRIGIRFAVKMKVISLLFGIICCFGFCLSADKELNQGDIRVRILGQSGKMTMSRGK